MYTNNQSNLSGRNYTAAYSLDELKSIIKNAHHELVKQKGENSLVMWDDILWYIKQSQLNPKPFFPEKSKLLWQMLDDMEVALILVRSRINLSKKRFEDDTKSSFLHVLSASSDSKKHELAVLMIKLRAKVNDKDADGNSPLYYAVKSEAFSVIEAIINRVVNGTFVEIYDYEKCIDLAVQSPNADKLLKLLFQNVKELSQSNGFSWDMPDNHIMTKLKILLQLANENQEEILDYIFRKASLKNLKFFNMKCNELINPQRLLSVKRIIENPAMISFVIDEGANINDYASNKKEYPLHIAEDPRTVLFLLRLGADVNVINKFGKTPFSRFQSCGSLNVDKAIVMMIKKFACLTTEGRKINDNDLSIIQNKPEWQKFYESCLKELDKIKTMSAIDGFQYHYFFSESNYQISRHVKCTEKFKQLRKNLLQFKAVPIFKGDMLYKLGMARRLANCIERREEEVKEVFTDLFNIELPRIVIRKIIMYSFDVINFEKEYYLVHFDQITI